MVGLVFKTLPHPRSQASRSSPKLLALCTKATLLYSWYFVQYGVLCGRSTDGPIATARIPAMFRAAASRPFGSGCMSRLCGQEATACRALIDAGMTCGSALMMRTSMLRTWRSSTLLWQLLLVTRCPQVLRPPLLTLRQWGDEVTC